MTQAGYCEQLGALAKEESATVMNSLKAFVSDADESQIRAWRESFRLLKKTANELIMHNPDLARNSGIIFEYMVPLESRRIDVLLLLPGVIIVIEFKGKESPSRADIDQAAAYARDLRAYHRECSEVPVRCLLILMNAAGNTPSDNGVDIIGTDGLVSYCEKHIQCELTAQDPTKFLDIECYQPLPSLIKAARELFKSGTIKRIHRAAIATEPTVAACSAIVHRTSNKKRRSLVIISGVPGAGKTLVGLQLAHAKYFDDLAIERGNGGKPTAPAVFLSGNGPLVEVLQYELRSAGGDGKAFVRGVHDYVKTFTRKAGLIPPQHVLIYDEAQRAFDAAQVEAKHRDMPFEFRNLSEPELFIQFAERVPEWCVVVGLIGSGQEIHIGEEAGLGQWKTAIENSLSPGSWDIYLPSNKLVSEHFTGLANVSHDDALELSVTIRFHLATRLYDFVKAVLEGTAEEAKAVSLELERNGYNLRLTHDLGTARAYLKARYEGQFEARFGIVASAKDKDLPKYGIPKGFKSPGELGPGRYGKWYSEPSGISGSCTELNMVATEFGAQGLELDACLVAWGTDFIRENGYWTNRYASGYREMNRIKDAHALRKNAYRVLLTRARDGCVVYIPPIKDMMRETYDFLRDCGFAVL